MKASRDASPLIIKPGDAIGVFGGGQLGRMLAVAAARLGLRTIIYSDQKDPPAADCAHDVVVARYDDRRALQDFSTRISVATTEFENVPADALAIMAESGANVAPNAKAVAAAQDRLIEKQALEAARMTVAPYAPVDAPADLAAAFDRDPSPAILKTRRMGYDGKGQIKISERGELEQAWRAIGERPAILEKRIEFLCEFSIIAARARNGDFVVYDAPKNTHRDGVLRRSDVPSHIPGNMEAEAAAATRRLMDALDYVGVLAVEFFLTAEGFIANEFAPRVHNTGHWTIEACAVDQFEQHIRAICGWPLGAATRLLDATMINLIGEDVDRWREIAAAPNAALHLYGKSEKRPGRKMGHATYFAPLGGKIDPPPIEI